MKRTTAFNDARQFLGEHKRWDRFPRTYQGYVKALRGQHRELADALWHRFQQRVETLAGSLWRWKNWVPLALDGSRLECPRTPANEEALGCAGRKKTAPQIQITELWHMPTALPWSATFGSGTKNEQVAFRDQFDQLPPHSLIVADAGFYSYETAQTLIDRGHAFVIRVGGNKELLKDLFGAGHCKFGSDQQVYAWPEGIRRQGNPPLELRLIEIPTANAEEPNVFLLTPLPRHELSDDEASHLYAQRWGSAEIGYRTHKQTLQAAKVRSRTPDLALCEAEWTVLSIFLLGALALQHRTVDQLPGNDWSPAGTLHVVRDRIKHSICRGGRWSRRICRDLR